MTILNRIIEYKIKEVAARKQAFPVSLLKQSGLYGRTVFSMSESLKNSKTGIIAEHKRRSPSKSVINNNVLLHEVVSGYQDAGVAAVSVLTDTCFFGGSLDDLLLAREVLGIPVLRKEFVIDPYQLHEAKAYGADAVLLIAAALERPKIKELAGLAGELGLEVLLEVHNEAELAGAIDQKVQMIGVNNRNLKTFDVSIETSKHLAEMIPSAYVRVSESGISTPEAMIELRDYGYMGFLMGEHFMRDIDPGQAANTFIEKLL